MKWRQFELFLFQCALKIIPFSSIPYTSWKMSVFIVFLVRIFPHLDWIRENRDRKTPNMDTFHAVIYLAFHLEINQQWELLCRSSLGLVFWPDHCLYIQSSENRLKNFIQKNFRVLLSKKVVFIWFSESRLTLKRLGD